MRHQQKPSNRPRDSCQHAIQPLQQDLGEGGGTGPVERRNHHQADKKKGDLRDCSNYRGIMLLSAPGNVLNRVLLERMKEAVDPKLRDQQAGFRRNRSCADQIASLRIIVEQSLEWNSPLYINFIDYEKAFDSVDSETMWKLLRHYGVPEKTFSLIRCSFQDMSCRIAHTGQNRQGKSSFRHAQKHLGIWRNQHENLTPHLQLQCEVSPALRT